MRNTSTVCTPAPQPSLQPSGIDVNSSMMVQTGDLVPWTRKEADETKRYADNFKIIVKVLGFDINFFPAGSPEVVNLLYDKGQCVKICEYTPQGMYNAYYALVQKCESDARIFYSKFKSGELATYEDFYAAKQLPNSGITTPPLKHPFL